MNAGTVSGGLTNTAGTTSNSGTINGGATVSGGTLTTTGTIAGGLTNSATVNAQGTISGAIANNSTGTFIQTGTLTFNPGLGNGFSNSEFFAANGASNFGGGTLSNTGLVDITSGSALNNIANFQNAGMVRIAPGAIASINGGTFTNGGVINMQNGAANDRLTIGGNYVGIPGSQLLLDFAPQSNTADRLVITGNASGSTAVAVNNLNPGVPFTTSPTMVQVNGTVAAKYVHAGYLAEFRRA